VVAAVALEVKELIFFTHLIELFILIYYMGIYVIDHVIKSEYGCCAAGTTHLSANRYSSG
jgi:hypothetical protein